MKLPLGLAFFVSLFAVSLAAKPNVVVIFIDDQGYYDLGCYGATEVNFSKKALLDLKKIEALGLGGLPVCMAKTQKSFSDFL